MCESLDRMREESFLRGKVQGEAAGIQRGRIQGETVGMQKGKIQGRAEGKAEGIQEGILIILKTLLQKGITESYILDITGVSSELLLKAKQELN